MNKYLAPAKVNLHLAITNVRDDGYHELDTSFVFTDLHDELTIKLAPDLLVRCSIPAFDGPSNLVYQILSAFRIKYQVKQGLDVFIKKNIPAQAGLGGGSSDAATALLVANRLWGIGASPQELINFAVSFGADIPCFLFGKASTAKGIGERLVAYAGQIPDQCMVLAWPGEGVSTAQAFAHFDRNEFHALTEEKAAAKVRARSDGDGFEMGFNDLEQSAITICAPLAKMLKVMREKSERAWMSGSGSACVAVCSTLHQAENVVSILQSQNLATWTHIGHFVREHPLVKE